MKTCTGCHSCRHVGGMVARMKRLANEDGKFEGFDIFMILLMVFLLFGISLSIA